MVLYTDPETGVPVSTHSMLKTMRRCPKQAEFKYKMRLKPKVMGKPLKRGVWVHRLLQVHYNAEDWREEHARLSYNFSQLFDEEKDFYGDLPREIFRIMGSYFWHYKKHDWEVLDTEFILECTFPDGSKFRCKIDLLVRDQFGLWIVDHKSHARLPSLLYRILDAQSADYVWCAIQNKLQVEGHIWNYVRWKPASIPQLVYKGTKSERLSTRQIETDFPTFAKALKDYGLDPNKYAAQLRTLRAQRYVHGAPQTSPFFRRDILEKSPAMLRQVAQEAYHTSRRLHSYIGWKRPNLVERVIERSCEFMCGYNDLCAAQLWGANINSLIKQKYTVGDPLDYYNDDDRHDDMAGRGE